MNELWLLLLPVAAASGWLFSHKRSASQNNLTNASSATLSSSYFIGLNYLLNEQPDKAVDVFIKMLEVDSETVETHLALGNLFRRGGEVDRAIRIHQNLIARPQLTKIQRSQALLALGQDYMSAGFLDRAEKIFIELLNQGELLSNTLIHLLDIYQQEKDWQQAIRVAKQLEIINLHNKNTEVAHYHCELALQARTNSDLPEAKHLLKRALAIDTQCVRATLLRGEIEIQLKKYKHAIEFYQNVPEQNSAFISEILQPLALCYSELDQKEEFAAYLKNLLIKHPQINIVLLLAEHIKETKSLVAAQQFISDQLHTLPSLKGICKLLGWHLAGITPNLRDELQSWLNVAVKLLEEKSLYRCHNCGFAGKELHWQCPGCKQWSTTKPITHYEND